MGFFRDVVRGVAGGVVAVPGVAKDVFGGITGRTAAEAAKDAARIQAQAGQQAIEQLRSDLAPVRGTLETSLPLLTQFIGTPMETPAISDILNNPLLRGLFDDVTQRTLASQAAGGRVGAGDTGPALLNQLIPIGLDFQNQLFNQALAGRGQRLNELFNVAGLGENAAAQTGTSTADLLTQIGNARAAGITGAANARQQGMQNLFGIGSGAALGGMGMLGPGVGAGGGALLGMLSDERLKKDVKKIGEVNGVSIYEYRYIDDDSDIYTGVMAQEVEKIYPNVIQEHDGIKFVDYDKLNEYIQWH